MSERELFEQILRKLTEIHATQESILMSATALTAAVEALQPAAQAIIAFVQQSGNDQAAIDSATATIQNVTQTLTAAVPAPAAPTS